MLLQRREHIFLIDKKITDRINYLTFLPLIN